MQGVVLLVVDVGAQEAEHKICGGVAGDGVGGSGGAVDESGLEDAC